jgi:predicted Zn-dependent protease
VLARWRGAHKQRTLLVCLLGGLLVACAPLPPNARSEARNEHARQNPPPVLPPEVAPVHQEMPAWDLADLVATEHEAVGFLRGEYTVAVLPASSFRAMASAAARLTEAVKEEPPLFSPRFQVVEGYGANAYAINRKEKPAVAVNFGLVKMLGDDEGLWAAVLGHELAHLKRQHQQRRNERNEWSTTVSGIVSVVLGFVGVPLAPLLTDTASNVVTLGYSRDDELEADALSVTYMRRAGYDPVAALRFHQRLAERSQDSGGLWSTHPGGQERVEAIRNLLAPSSAR